MPLTLGQRVSLLMNCLPFISFSLMMAAYLFLVRRRMAGPPFPVLDLVVVAALLFTGYDASKSLRGLISGVA